MTAPLARKWFVLFLAAGIGVLSLALSGCAPLPPEAERPVPLQTFTPPPADLMESLKGFRAEGPPGWSYTLTTQSAGKIRVERYNPLLRGAERWTLLSENGAPPTEETQQRYRATRPALDSAAALVGQLHKDTVALVAHDEATETYEFTLSPSSDSDRAWPHLRARFVRDRATAAFRRVELFSVRAFRPARSLAIHEVRTILTYTEATPERPALPLKVEMRVKGKRFFFVDFDEYVVASFSDHARIAGPQPRCRERDE